MPDSAMRLIERTTSEILMYYIGLDIHKKTISYCVNDASGQIHREGKIGSTRCEPDSWIETLPQPLPYHRCINARRFREQLGLRSLSEGQGRGFPGLRSERGAPGSLS